MTHGVPVTDDASTSAHVRGGSALTMVRPETSSISLPRNCTWSTGVLQPGAIPVPDTWPPGDCGERIVTYTASRNTIVPIGGDQPPSINWGGPWFGTLTGIGKQWSAEQIQTCLEAVGDHLEPRFGPGTCHYGVRYRNAQAYGTTPDRFVADLDGGLATVFHEREEFTEHQAHCRPRQVGACLWPTDHGWFCLQARQREGKDTMYVEFGVFDRGLATEPTQLRPFFEACGCELPRRQELWPLRQLIIERPPMTPLERSVEVSEVLEPPAESADAPLLHEHGANPVFGTSREQFPRLSESLHHSLFDPLSKVSTLLYNRSAAPVDRPSALERVIALDPPLDNAVFVIGTYRLATTI